MSFVTQDAAGQQLCLFGHTGMFCGQPAVYHIIGEGDTFTMGCLMHAYWWDTHPYQDRHIVGPDCGMPGTHWVVSTPDGTGTCRLIRDAYPNGAE